ncbi:2-amino-4-hydroxy-6-hydroxymethyldihydropteridine diphosphokinase [Paenibacillus sp. GCM10023252]|uniref:2-amino-4-hydroxy-6- hydroxymethyldihydropteridine diphosphokinase n=1 Tax=Paenibacillus sp. GCM10023252 TaxID=3252649 RepID=UPI00360A1984
MEGSFPSRNEDVQHEAYIALGANLGDREATLMRAIEQLQEHAEIIVTRRSGLYETDPVGYTEQPAFMNMVIAIRTSLTPLHLLRLLLGVERQLGRVRDIRWGPRTIDLDLLLYDGVTMEEEELMLPHPRMMERSFVLVPLHDVLPEPHPLYQDVHAASSAALRDRKDGIKLWRTIN